MDGCGDGRPYGTLPRPYSWAQVIAGGALLVMTWNWGRPFKSDERFGKILIMGWLGIGGANVLLGSLVGPTWLILLDVLFLLLGVVATGMAAGVIPRR